MNGHASTYSVSSFKPLLSKLLNSPSTFTPDDLRSALLHIASNQTSHAQTGSFLATLKIRNVVEENPEMIAVLVRTLTELSGKVDIGAEGQVCDLTWTGGSAMSVLNVALPAAIIAAGAGCRVCKAGNPSSPYPATPSSGDILTALSVPTNTLPAFALTQVARQRSVPFLHISIPRYSPHLAAISPLRQELGFSTILHDFASLISPAKRDYLVIGVHEERLGRVFAEGCKALNVKRAWVVHGKNGLDAISPEGETLVWDVKGGEITTRTLSPSDFGLEEHPLSDVQLPDSNAGSILSASAAYNYTVHAALVSSLLSPRRLRTSEPLAVPFEPDAYGTTRLLDTKAVEDFVCMNAAALLVVAGKARDEREALALARRSLKEGKAYHALEALRDAAALAVDVDEQMVHTP